MTSRELWLKLSEANRKRIVSFLNSFIVTFLILMAAQLNTGFPESWAALGALAVSLARTAVREALNLLVATLPKEQ
jgi:hypothetical protein